MQSRGLITSYQTSLRVLTGRKAAELAFFNERICLRGRSTKLAMEEAFEKAFVGSNFCSRRLVGDFM